MGLSAIPEPAERRARRRLKLVAVLPISIQIE
jgi:hypothetical protein